MAWTTIEELDEGWKLRFWDGGFGADKGVYLETPEPDAVRYAITYWSARPQKVTFSGSLVPVPKSVYNAVLAHFSGGYIEVYKRPVGKWDIIHAVRRGKHRIYIESNVHGFSDSPIKNLDGSVVYDFPGRVPQYVKRAVRHAFSKAFSEIYPKKEETDGLDKQIRD